MIKKFSPAKYIPNPDWILYKPWGYKFRKARFVWLIAICYDWYCCSFLFTIFRYVYVPEDENSSKSIEIERVMKEARLRELVKGVYNSSYSNDVAAMVNIQIHSFWHKVKCLNISRCHLMLMMIKAEIS